MTGQIKTFDKIFGFMVGGGPALLTIAGQLRSRGFGGYVPLNLREIRQLIQLEPVELDTVKRRLSHCHDLATCGGAPGG